MTAPGLYVADVLFTVNDTLADRAPDEIGGDDAGDNGTGIDETGGEAGAAKPGGLRRARVAATAAVAAAAYRAGVGVWPAPDEGIGERPPPEHEGYMVRFGEGRVFCVYALVYI
jgi:hypothetical protein